MRKQTLTVCGLLVEKVGFGLSSKCQSLMFVKALSAETRKAFSA